MLDSIEACLAAERQKYTDPRFQVFDIHVARLEGGLLKLEGSVLQKENLNQLLEELRTAFPGLEVDDSAVKILRATPARLYTVAVNLTHLQSRPDWMEETVSQLLFGWQVEVLDEQDRWVFVRQMDGYLGWAYLPYLRRSPAPFPTHLLLSPEAPVRLRPGGRSPLVSRLLGGTGVHVMETKGRWAKVAAHQTGWLPLSDLRGLEQFPLDEGERRSVMMQDAARMLGVPYLWGGISAYGIDCSGLSQLLHRWIGIPIPRDADLQYEAGQKVEPPFQSGDLLFYGEGGDKRQITHVSISIGGWKIIHSSRSRNGVYYDDVLADRYLRERFIGACCFLR